MTNFTTDKLRWMWTDSVCYEILTMHARDELDSQCWEKDRKIAVNDYPFGCTACEKSPEAFIARALWRRSSKSLIRFLTQNLSNPLIRHNILYGTKFCYTLTLCFFCLVYILVVFILQIMLMLAYLHYSLKSFFPCTCQRMATMYFFNFFFSVF